MCNNIITETATEAQQKGPLYASICKNHKKYFPINGVLLRKIERMDENKKNCPLNENSS
jgi:ribosomal protein S3AE